MAMKKWLMAAFIIILILLGCGGASISTHNNSNNNLKPDELKQKYIVYEYYADWCSICRKLAPVLQDLEASSDGKIKVNRINIDHHQKLAQEKGIRAVPTLILSDGVYDIAKSVGYKSYNDLAAWIHKVDQAR
jgi:thioredoxin 1